MSCSTSDTSAEHLDPVGLDPADRPTLLLIGADRALLAACLRHSVDTVVVMGASQWDKGLVDIPPEFGLLRVDDQTSAEAVLLALRRAGLGTVEWDAVYTGDERALVAVSLLAEHLGCWTHGPEVLVGFRDKVVQKRIVAAAGIPTARATTIEDVYDVSDVVQLPYSPAVLKPVAGAATARTTVVHSLDELRERSREYAFDRVPQRTFVLEEYVEGEEWIVDGVVFDGEIVFRSMARYGMPCIDTVSSGVPLSMWRFDRTADAWVYDRAESTTRTALAALGLQRGVFHLELFYDRDADVLTFGECAARRGGALVQEEVLHKFGVDLAECTLQCALGRRPEPVVRERPGVVGSGYLPGARGVLVDCPTPAQLGEREGVEFARVELPIGSAMHGSGDTNSRLGQVLVTADTPAEFDQRLAQVRGWFAERIAVVPDPATPRDLRAWQRQRWPQADFREPLCH